MMVFTGKVAVVRGVSAPGGIGWATAHSYAARGAKLVVGARRREPLERPAAEIDGLALVRDAANEPDIIAFARVGVPQDIADVAMWLSEPNYLSGRAIPVSGGSQLTRLPRSQDEMPNGEAHPGGDVPQRVG